MAQIENTVENAVKGAIQQVEQHLDDEIGRLNNLQDDDLEAIRKKRLAQMRKAAEDRAIWKRNGHGAVHQIPEREFFTRSKGSQRVVAIFYRPGTSRFTQDLLDHVARIAERHLETLFVTVEAEKAPFLCEKLKIRVLPTLVFVKDSEINQVLVGLDQISTSGKFTTTGVEKRLFDFEMLTDTNIADDS